MEYMAIIVLFILCGWLWLQSDMALVVNGKWYLSPFLIITFLIIGLSAGLLLLWMMIMLPVVRIFRPRHFETTDLSVPKELLRLFFFVWMKYYYPETLVLGLAVLDWIYAVKFPILH